MTERNVAIAIGVSRPTGFVRIPGAAADAARFHAWAQKAGFESHLFSDSSGPVRVGPIAKLIADLVKVDGNVTRLLVYFAGHGIATSTDADYWLLSAGTTDSGEVIDVAGSLKFAINSQLPHIAVFADACRTGETFRHQDAVSRGTAVIFPAGAIAGNAAIDRFYASFPGAPAQEITDPQSRKAQGLFTEALLKALQGGVDIDQPGPNAEPVVLAPDLGRYLDKAVSAQAEERRLKPQRAWCRTESQPPLFISTVETVPLVDCTVRLVIDGPAPAAAPEVEFLAMDQSLPPKPVGNPIRAAGPPYTARVYRKAMVGVRVRLPGYGQVPPAFQPFLPAGVREGVVVLQRLAAAAPVAPLAAAAPRAPAGRMVPPPHETLVQTVVVDDAGTEHDAAPAAGMYRVTSRDLVTGRVLAAAQPLQAGEYPLPVEGMRWSERAVTAVERAADSPGRGHFETRTGLSIYGAKVSGYAVAGLRRTDPSAPGRRGFYAQRGAWHIADERFPHSAVISLSRDRYAALAFFPDFAGSVVVDAAGVRHLSFLPAENSSFWVPEAQQRHIRESMALGEEAARRGNFGLTIDDRRSVAQALRAFKHQDPGLGILAAVAYAQDGDGASVKSIADYFRAAGQAVPFDVALLAGEDVRNLAPDVAPAWPLLTQLWWQMGPDDALHPAIAAARQSLARSLWATVRGPAGAALGDALARGELR
jgi:Caspase domain